MAISSDLEQLLSAWLPRQGWFPKLETELGADPDITPMSITVSYTHLTLPTNREV